MLNEKRWQSGSLPLRFRYGNNLRQQYVIRLAVALAKFGALADRDPSLGFTDLAHAEVSYLTRDRRMRLYPPRSTSPTDLDTVPRARKRYDCRAWAAVSKLITGRFLMYAEDPRRLAIT